MNNNIYPRDYVNSTFEIKRNQCFFIMPFSTEYDRVFSQLKKDLKESGYTLIRVDDIPSSTAIMNKILSCISTSQYIIADISDLNSNVFYELGIAHCLKESRNVILIKNRETRAPSDIHHITYIEYDKDNIMLLKEEIIASLDRIKYYSDLEDALRIRQICASMGEVENTISILDSVFSQKEIRMITDILSDSDGSNVDGSAIANTLLSEIKKRENSINSIESNPIVKTYISIIGLLSLKYNYRDYVFSMLYHDKLFFREETSIVFKTLLSTHIASLEIYLDTVMPWIIEYLSQSKSCHVDLNRYKIESFLLTSQDEKVDEFIINAVLHEDRHVREHMADIIGDKGLNKALNNLVSQLGRENNIYSAASIIEAIGKVGCIDNIAHINQWIVNNFECINNPGGNFVFKHALNAIARLDRTEDSKHINEFKGKYMDYMFEWNNKAYSGNKSISQ